MFRRIPARQLLDSDGHSWFSTSKGPVGIDPDNIKVNQLPPPVLIEKMLVDGQPVYRRRPAGGSVRIPPGAASI